MGKIKSTMIKRTSRQLLDSSPDSFSESFDDNKKALSNNTMPSKKLRNSVAGYIARLKRQNKKIISEED
jgi:small subunit ribosomal protein S17e